MQSILGCSCHPDPSTKKHSQASADMQVSPTSGPTTSSPAKWAALSGLRQASRRTVPAASSWHRGSAASRPPSIRGRPGRCMTWLRFAGSRVSACSCHRTWLLRWRAAGSATASLPSSSSTSCRAGPCLPHKVRRCAQTAAYCIHGLQDTIIMDLRQQHGIVGLLPRSACPAGAQQCSHHLHVQTAAQVGQHALQQGMMVSDLSSIPCSRA